jgi:hypothetical protein
MRTLDVVITLQDDCIFSERNATEGAHQALDYIPGGALLGAVAARLYAELGNNQAFDWFHSGKMRFGNAYPLVDGKRTFPMPACWHQAKGKSPIKDGKLDNHQIWRLDECENHALPDNQQPQQLRAGYLSLDGYIAKTNKSFRMKTAIDADTGRAKESALFGYDALQAGQRFYAQISCDDAMTEADITRLKATLSKPQLLGRSRSAEYGRATAEILQTQPALSSEQPNNLKITLWLLSDLMALDEYGQPILSPAPQHLGLPKGELVAENSFLRTRRYSTWNAHKQGYELERQVISKGSVLVYQLESSLTDEHLQLIAAGLGVERQAGLGQVWLNPPLLADKQPHFEKSVASLADKAKELPKPAKEPELIAWLRKQQSDSGSKQNFARDAKRIARGYQALMESTRGLKGLDASVHVGPSHSQWGAVLAAAKSRRELETFMNATDGSFKPRGEGWKDEFWQSEQLVSFYNWFRNHYQQQNSPPFIQHLVREIMAELKDQKGGRA